MANRVVKVFLSASLMLFLSCAQVVSPTGGPRDVTPPHAERYIPDSAAVKFSSGEINIFFNEYIQLKDINSSLIVSPPLKYTPEITARNKILNIKLLDTLLPNTTYTMNFGNAVTDITEGNPVENFQYVFSTGNKIDSLSVSGTVQNSYDQKKEKGILVMMYQDTSIVAPYKQIPSYFSKTREDGAYIINNIAEGGYRIVALKDADKNYLFNSTEELIGFSDSLINMNRNKNLNLEVFKENSEELHLRKHSTPQTGKLVLAFNRPVENIDITDLNNSGLKVLKEFSLKRDTLSVWFPDPNFEKTSVLIKENEKIIDTVLVQFRSRDKNFGKGSQSKLALKPSAGNNVLLNIGKPLIIEFSQPVKTFIASSVSLSDYHNKINPSVSFADSVKRILTINYNYLPDSTYSLLIPAGTFTDIFGFTNDSLKLKFRLQPEKYYGNIKLKVTVPVKGEDYILQLLDEREISVQEKYLKNNELLSYDYLPPGKYRFRIICDNNHNHKWDTGNYLKRQQPEKIIYFSKLLTIRSNWETEEEWVIK